MLLWGWGWQVERNLGSTVGGKMIPVVRLVLEYYLEFKYE